MTRKDTAPYHPHPDPSPSRGRGEGCDFLRSHRKCVMRFSTLVIFAAILIALPLTASAAGGPSRDEALLAAHAAFLAGDKVKLARRAADIRDHVLAPYVDFWRLRLNLEEAAPGEIKDFLARHAGTALAEQLRREWLVVLGKNGQWELFREDRPSPAPSPFSSRPAC